MTSLSNLNDKEREAASLLGSHGFLPHNLTLLAIRGPTGRSDPRILFVGPLRPTYQATSRSVTGLRRSFFQPIDCSPPQVDGVVRISCARAARAAHYLTRLGYHLLFIGAPSTFERISAEQARPRFQEPQLWTSGQPIEAVLGTVDHIETLGPHNLPAATSWCLNFLSDLSWNAHQVTSSLFSSCQVLDAIATKLGQVFGDLDVHRKDLLLGDPEDLKTPLYDHAKLIALMALVTELVEKDSEGRLHADVRPSTPVPAVAAEYRALIKNLPLHESLYPSGRGWLRDPRSFANLKLDPPHAVALVDLNLHLQFTMDLLLDVGPVLTAASHREWGHGGTRDLCRILMGRLGDLAEAEGVFVAPASAELGPQYDHAVALDVRSRVGWAHFEDSQLLKFFSDRRWRPPLSNFRDSAPGTAWTLLDAWLGPLPPQEFPDLRSPLSYGPAASVSETSVGWARKLDIHGARNPSYIENWAREVLRSFDAMLPTLAAAECREVLERGSNRVSFNECLPRQ